MNCGELIFGIVKVRCRDLKNWSSLSMGVGGVGLVGVGKTTVLVCTGWCYGVFNNPY